MSNYVDDALSGTQDILDKISALKEKAVKLTEQAQDAKARDAVIAEQMKTLTSKLQEVAGTVDWDQMQELIAKAAEAAEKGVQRLQEALREAGLDSE